MVLHVPVGVLLLAVRSSQAHPARPVNKPARRPSWSSPSDTSPEGYYVIQPGQKNQANKLPTSYTIRARPSTEGTALVSRLPLIALVYQARSYTLRRPDAVYGTDK